MPVSQHLDAEAEGPQLQGQPGLHSENNKGLERQQKQSGIMRINCINKVIFIDLIERVQVFVSL